MTPSRSPSKQRSDPSGSWPPSPRAGVAEVERQLSGVLPDLRSRPLQSFKSVSEFEPGRVCQRQFCGGELAQVVGSARSRLTAVGQGGMGWPRKRPTAALRGSTKLPDVQASASRVSHPRTRHSPRPGAGQVRSFGNWGIAAPTSGRSAHPLLSRNSRLRTLHRLRSRPVSP